MSSNARRILLAALAMLACAPASALAQADRTVVVGEAPTFTFEGEAALGTNVTTELGAPECSKLFVTYCDMTLIEIKKPGLVTFVTDVPDSSDIDTSLYESDASGARGKILKEGAGFIGDDETFAYDADPGYVLFVAAYYFSLQAGFTVNGTFEPTVAEVPPAAPPANRAPEAAITKLAKSVRAGSLKSFRGSANDADGTVAKVEIGLIQLTRGKTCRRLATTGKFVSTGKCTPSRFLAAKGTTAWSYNLRKPLPKGKYVLYARAIDDKGAVQGGFAPASKKTFTVR